MGILWTYKAYEALPFAGGFRRPLRPLTRKNRTKIRVNEEDREVHGYRCKLTTCNKSSMVHESNPDAACMDEVERAERREVYRQHHTS